WDDAITRAGSDEMAHAHDFGIGVKSGFLDRLPYQRIPPERQVKNVSITATVKARLASDLNPTTLTNLSVNVTNGVVTLAGQVPTEADKQRAEEIARRVDGVVRVNNNLQIQSS